MSNTGGRQVDDNRRSLAASLSLAMLLTAAGLAVTHGLSAQQVDLSGNLGYTLRTLEGEATGETTSHQGRASLNGRGYLWQPWVAALDFGLNLTGDTSRYSDADSTLERTNLTTLVTGDVGLSLLPKSRTPFRLTWRQNDSRVDNYIRHDVLNALPTTEYSSRRLAMTQSYFTENGNRFQLRYDDNLWTSQTSSYGDTLLGADMNMRMQKQTLIAKTSLQETDYSTLDQKSTRSVINVDHFYTPSRALRIDTMGSLYGFSRTSNQPLNSTNSPDSETDLAQMSSFVFYRPENRPLSLSGGVRVYDLAGQAAGAPVEVNSANATAGMLWQYTKNIRLDARFDLITNENEAIRSDVMQQRYGALYQSDLHRVFSDASWQWYLSGAMVQRDAEQEGTPVADTTQNAKLGHDVQKSWRSSETAGWRVSLSQTVSGDTSSGDSGERETQRLDHSFSLSRDRRLRNGTAMTQFTVSDSRSAGDAVNEQQFVNVQYLRNRNLTRRSELSGNLTAQWVRQDFNEGRENDTVTTATGQVHYRHSRIMGIPRLRFGSDLRLALAATEEGIDRLEWENRLDYAVGLLDTRLSWRTIELDGNSFDLVYFQATRRF